MVGLAHGLFERDRKLDVDRIIHLEHEPLAVRDRLRVFHCLQVGLRLGDGLGHCQPDPHGHTVRVSESDADADA